MILRFSFSLVFILSCFGIQVASAMDLAERGWVPSMGKIPYESPLEQKNTTSCTPFAAKCNSECCISVSQVSTVVAKQRRSQDTEAHRGEVEKLRKLLKEAIKTVGKSEAVKIMATEIAESPDTDTQSASNSPGSGDESVFDQLLAK